VDFKKIFCSLAGAAIWIGLVLVALILACILGKVGTKAPAQSNAFPASFYVIEDSPLHDYFSAYVSASGQQKKGFRRINTDLSILAGDTFTSAAGNAVFRISYIATPEAEQPQGIEAREHLKRILSNLYLLSNSGDEAITDESGTILVSGFSRSAETDTLELLQSLMLKNGLAYVDSRQCGDFMACIYWRREQLAAQAAGIGIWEGVKNE
jgi:endonuclease YncB( thermonuclease family)